MRKIFNLLVCMCTFRVGVNVIGLPDFHSHYEPVTIRERLKGGRGHSKFHR